MKFPVVLALCFALFSTHASAQEANNDPNGGTLVDCGKEKVVVFDETTTKDGHYALAWTIRPKHATKPVDWSKYRPDELDDWLEPYDVQGDYAFDTYAPVNGVLDLRAKKFTVLPCAFPYLPHRAHDGFGVTWSEEQHGERYGVVTNYTKFQTENLWLVTIDAAGVRPADFIHAAQKAAETFMRKHERKNYQRYGYGFNPDEDAADGTDKSHGPFKEGTVTIAWSAAIPRTEEGYYSGTFVITLAKGTITRVTAKPM